ncbi:MAG: hypothetical protein Q9226_003075 [Calogaya cf. arnoldii]
MAHIKQEHAGMAAQTGSQAVSDSSFDILQAMPKIGAKSASTYATPEPVNVYLINYIRNGEASGSPNRVYRSNLAAIHYCGLLLGLGPPPVLNLMDYWVTDGLWIMDDVNNEARCVIQEHRLNQEAPLGTLSYDVGRSDPNMVYLVCGFINRLLLENGLFGGVHVNWTTSCAVWEVCENKQRAYETRDEHTGMLNATRGGGEGVGANVLEAWLY